MLYTYFSYLDFLPNSYFHITEEANTADFGSFCRDSFLLTDHLLLLHFHQHLNIFKVSPSLYQSLVNTLSRYKNLPVCSGVFCYLHMAFQLDSLFSLSDTTTWIFNALIFGCTVYSSLYEIT